jgi:pimeloyl-ACP methyl ester carboxylesterase/DNA-binding CsgD family transcriptional regulator
VRNANIKNYVDIIASIPSHFGIAVSKSELVNPTGLEDSSDYFRDLKARFAIPIAVYDKHGNRLDAAADPDGFPSSVTARDELTSPADFFDFDGGLYFATTMPEAAMLASRDAYTLVMRIEKELIEETASSLHAPVQITRAEFVLISLLLTGHELKDIAALTNTTYETKRNQLKMVLGKFQVKNQRGIVKAVSLSLIKHLTARIVAEPIRGQEDVLARAEFNDEILRLRFTPTSGRTLPAWELGARGGKPVVYFHTWTAILPFTAEDVGLLKENNLRWHVIPRFFWPSTASEPQILLEQFAADVAEYIRTYIGAPVTCVANNSGTPWAVALARHAPDVIDRLILSGCPFPPSQALEVKQSASWQHAFLRLNQKNPAIGRNVLKIYARLGLKKALLSAAYARIYSENPNDLFALKKLIDRGMMSQWIRLFLSAAPEKYADELAVSRVHWDKLVRLLQCPVDFFHGTNDHMTPIEMVDKIEKHHDQSRLVAIAGGGHMVAVSHFERLVEFLVNR